MCTTLIDSLLVKWQFPSSVLLCRRSCKRQHNKMGLSSFLLLGLWMNLIAFSNGEFIFRFFYSYFVSFSFFIYSLGFMVYTASRLTLFCLFAFFRYHSNEFVVQFVFRNRFGFGKLYRVMNE